MHQLYKPANHFLTSMDKRGVAVNPIDLIAGVVIILAGIVTIFNMVNLGVVLAGIGLLIEGMKIMMQQGL